MSLLFGILYLLQISHILSFHSPLIVRSFVTIQSKNSLSVLSMGGGRSQAEVGLSKRQMFRNIRDKLNTAAKVPGFFSELGEDQEVNFTLYISMFTTVTHYTVYFPSLPLCAHLKQYHEHSMDESS